VRGTNFEEPGGEDPKGRDEDRGRRRRLVVQRDPQIISDLMREREGERHNE
jgi:hypothetical protein